MKNDYITKLELKLKLIQYEQELIKSFKTCVFGKNTTDKYHEIQEKNREKLIEEITVDRLTLLNEIESKLPKERMVIIEGGYNDGYNNYRAEVIRTIESLKGGTNGL